ncbi:MAG: NAD(P)H-binding protein [Gammaproteobacteria bacterium]|nr:NAD(P)H-binding protein [Gammaproteobacteria bacterium]
MTTVLVVGATGKTGRSLVEQLLDKNHEVRVIVRSPDKFPPEVLQNANLRIVKAAVLDLSDNEICEQVEGCHAVVSCLGHVMDFKGMFGHPRKLCTEATRRLCEAIEKSSPPEPTKFILMNTVGVKNPDLEEKRSCFEKGLLALLRHTIPPHSDNETAVDYLIGNIERENKYIKWCSVRPDSLIDAGLTEYEIIESPNTGIFSGRPTSRSNVAHFMTELIENAEVWDTWQLRMPVIMNC